MPTTKTTSSIYAHILSTIEDLTSADLNSLLTDLEIQYLTDVLSYKFPDTPRLTLEKLLISEYYGTPLQCNAVATPTDS